MKSLEIYKTELEIYSKFELLSGTFLFLDELRNPSNTPKSFGLFKDFLIHSKKFNPNNFEEIQRLYNLYKELCISQKYMEDNRWIRRNCFKIIKDIYPTPWNIKYFLDRGYSEEESKNLVKTVANHTLKFLNIWEDFINSLELKTLNIHGGDKSKKIDRSTGKFYTQEKIEKTKKKKLGKYSLNFDTTIYSLFFNLDGTFLKDPVDYDFFVSELTNKARVNNKNEELLKNLYDFYIKKFNIPNYKENNIKELGTYSTFFEKTNGVRNIQSLYEIFFWTSRGFSEDEAKEKISKLQSDRSFSLDKAIKKYGEVEGPLKYKEYLDRRNQTLKKHKEENPLYGAMFTKTIDPSTGKYYEGERLLEKRREVCAANYLKGTLKVAEKIKNREVLTVWQKEFWMNKGFTEEEAKEKIVELMPKSNIEWFIEKYGEEEGKKRFLARSEKYKNTMNSKSDEEKIEIIKKRAKRPHKISKSSIKFFKEILRRLESENIIFDNKRIFMDTNEYMLYDHKMTTVYFYDFCLKDLMIIIEFNGIMYHPHYTITGDDLEKWSSLFYKIPGPVQRARDLRKEELAKENGFDYLVIWDNDEIESSINKAINLIKSKISNIN